MSQPRSGACAAALGGWIYVCGGCGGEGDVPGGSVERLSPAEVRWEPLPDMCERRRGAVALAAQGHLYVCGGEGGGSGEYVLSSVERFKPESWYWETLPPMSCHR